MKRPNERRAPKIVLDPVEWDFREVVAAVGAEHFRLLTDYEYAREHVRFAEKIVQWKQLRIQAPGSIPEEKTIGELLRVGFDALAPEAREVILTNFPDRGWNSLEWLVHFPAFPKPFAQADSGWRPSIPYERPIVIKPASKISDVRACLQNGFSQSKTAARVRKAKNVISSFS